MDKANGRNYSGSIEEIRVTLDLYVGLTDALMTVTPQRMRMIVHAFEDTLDRGLKKDGQVVVSNSVLDTASNADSSL